MRQYWNDEAHGLETVELLIEQHREAADHGKTSTSPCSGI
jgi:hypothetical protein